MDILLTFWPIALLAAIILFRFLKDKNNGGDRPAGTKTEYKYQKKPFLVTNAEQSFFKRIEGVISDEYYVFPQIPLSALVDHKVVGQNWKSAFAHVNRKTIDYVICDRDNLKPLLAIELDDWSHDKDDRINRDFEVERILKESGLPLVRFRDIKEMTDDELSKVINEKLSI